MTVLSGSDAAASCGPDCGGFAGARLTKGSPSELFWRTSARSSLAIGPLGRTVSFSSMASGVRWALPTFPMGTPRYVTSAPGRAPPVWARRTVMVLGLSNRMPARPTAAHAMATTPTTPTRMRLIKWRLVNFTASSPPSCGRHHEGREAAVTRPRVARIPVGRPGAQVDVTGVGGVVDARHRRRAGDLHLALLLAAARSLVRVAVAAAGVHARHFRIDGLELLDPVALHRALPAQVEVGQGVQALLELVEVGDDLVKDVLRLAAAGRQLRLVLDEQIRGGVRQVVETGDEPRQLVAVGVQGPQAGREVVDRRRQLAGVRRQRGRHLLDLVNGGAQRLPIGVEGARRSGLGVEQILQALGLAAPRLVVRGDHAVEVVGCHLLTSWPPSSTTCSSWAARRVRDKGMVAPSRSWPSPW